MALYMRQITLQSPGISFQAGEWLGSSCFQRHLTCRRRPYITKRLRALQHNSDYKIPPGPLHMVRVMLFQTHFQWHLNPRDNTYLSKAALGRNLLEQTIECSHRSCWHAAVFNHKRLWRLFHQACFYHCSCDFTLISQNSIQSLNTSA